MHRDHSRVMQVYCGSFPLLNSIPIFFPLISSMLSTGHELDDAKPSTSDTSLLGHIYETVKFIITFFPLPLILSVNIR